MTRLIKPLITCICAHYRQTNQICSKLFFLNQSKHILIFIQELCIYKTIAFYYSSLVIKKICKFFFSGFFSSHPVAYSRPPGRVSAPPRGENHWSRCQQTSHKGSYFWLDRLGCKTPMTFLTPASSNDADAQGWWFFPPLGGHAGRGD